MGGLTVRAAIERALPNESLVYFGDGANVPYGPRSKEEITRFVDEAVRLLVERNNVKMIVIACNAATGAAIEHLRANKALKNIPVIGMEPAVKPAALGTKTGTIGVLATAAAFRGELYQATAKKYRDKVRIIETVGEGFVELVENEQENSPEAYEIVRRAVWPMLEAGADRIVLGCTHYPFLAEQIRRVINIFFKEGETTQKAAQKSEMTDTAQKNPKNRADHDSEKTPKIAATDIQIVDSAPAIARRVEQLLTENNLHAGPALPAASTGDAQATRKASRKTARDQNSAAATASATRAYSSLLTILALGSR